MLMNFEKILMHKETKCIESEGRKEESSGRFCTSNFTKVTINIFNARVFTVPQSKAHWVRVYSGQSICFQLTFRFINMVKGDNLNNLALGDFRIRQLKSERLRLTYT